MIESKKKAQNPSSGEDTPFPEKLATVPVIEKF